MKYKFAIEAFTEFVYTTPQGFVLRYENGDAKFVALSSVGFGQNYCDFDVNKKLIWGATSC